MSKKRLILLALLLTAVLLTGCRTRTTGTEPRADTAANGEFPVPEAEKEESGQLPDTDSGDIPGDGNEPGTQEYEEPGAKTKENPNASRKEYDENAPAEIAAGTDRMLHSEGEGKGMPLNGEETQETVSRLNDQAGKEAAQTVAAREAAQTGVNPEAEEADSALTYFTVLISDRTGTLFECQRMNAYWETAGDHRTVFRTSMEHSLILNAGAYDVSARLLEENLKVDDGWVTRKNPGVIVKIVDSSVLGSGVFTDHSAGAVYYDLVSREGWRGIDAVQNRRVVLLSEELLQAPYLQTAATLIISRTAYPDLFSDVNPDEALQMLTEEATGTLPAGLFYYLGGE